jgi:hypothetical protein
VKFILSAAAGGVEGLGDEQGPERRPAPGFSLVNAATPQQ